LIFQTVKSVLNYTGLQPQVAKILGLENLSLWQRLNSLGLSG